MLTSRLSLITFFIAVGFLLTQLSGSLFAPVLPEAAKIFNVPPTYVKYTIAIFFAGYAVGQIFWGSCSDHYGRRKMARIATILYLCCITLAMLWRHIIFFYINYVLIGFAAANYTSVGNAMLKDLYPAEKLTKVIAFIGVIMGAGPLLAAIIGNNLVKYFGWDSLFIFLSVLAFIVLIGMFVVVPETLVQHKHVEQESFVNRSKLVLGNKVFQRSIIFLALSFATLTSYLAAASFLFTNVMHVNAYLAGWLLVLPTASYIAGALLVMFIIKNKNPWQLLRPCGFLLLIVALVFVVMALLNVTYSTIYVILLMATLFLVGMLVPLSKSGCMTAVTHSGGTTASLMKLLQSSTAAIISFVFASIGSVSFLPFAVLVLVVAIVISVIAFVYK